MSKKAFTLVELLAVVVILGIILLIAIPSVTKIVTEAKKDTLVSSAKLIAKATKADAALNNADEYLLDTDGKLWRKEKDGSYIEIKYNGKVIGHNTSVVILVNGNNAITNGIVCEDSSNWCLNGGSYLNNVTHDDVVAVAIASIYATVPDNCFTYTTTNNEITITNYTVSSTCKTSLAIPSSIGGVPVVTIDGYAFVSKNIIAVEIPNSVVSIGVAAFGNNKLTSITIPNSVVSIDTSAFVSNQLSSVTIGSGVITIGNGAFWNNKIDSLTIGSSVTTIGVSAFEDNQLTNVTIPTSVTLIGESSFKDNQLTSLTIGSGVITIGRWAFEDNELTSVTIPANVTSIGKTAFLGNSFSTVTIEGDPNTRFNADWTDIGFDPAPMPE